MTPWFMGIELTNISMLITIGWLFSIIMGINLLFPFLLSILDIILVHLYNGVKLRFYIKNIFPLEIKLTTYLLQLIISFQELLILRLRWSCCWAIKFSLGYFNNTPLGIVGILDRLVCSDAIILKKRLVLLWKAIIVSIIFWRKAPLLRCLLMNIPSDSSW